MSETNGQVKTDEAEETQPFERTVILTFNGGQVSCHVEGGSAFEAPALLRRAAKQIEAQLTGE